MLECSDNGPELDRGCQDFERARTARERPADGQTQSWRFGRVTENQTELLSCRGLVLWYSACVLSGAVSSLVTSRPVSERLCWSVTREDCPRPIGWSRRLNR